MTTFDFKKYQTIFNAGNDKGALEFWADDLTVTLPVGPNQIGVIASNKEEFAKFLAAAHDGIREIMRIQAYTQTGDQIFVEFDMDFRATKDKPDFNFGPLKAGQFLTVKMFGLYTLRNDKLWKLRMAFWPTNQGVSDPPAYNWGVAPPDDLGGTRARF